jgi:hypothetical protein
MGGHSGIVGWADSGNTGVLRCAQDDDENKGKGKGEAKQRQRQRRNTEILSFAQNDGFLVCRNRRLSCLLVVTTLRLVGDDGVLVSQQTAFLFVAKEEAATGAASSLMLG